MLGRFGQSRVEISNDLMVHTEIWHKNTPLSLKEAARKPQ